MVFDKYFFKEHQHSLLRALNNPFAGWVARRGLWIEDRKHPVVKITPESYHVLLPDGEIQATIYATNQYAQALHLNAKPLWETLHWWDMKIANRLVPSLNAGFDTYTSQPDGAAGVDTRIRNDIPTTNFGTDASLIIGGIFGTVEEKHRSLIKFNFSTIPASSSVISGSLSLWLAVDYSSNARTARVYRQKRDWVEGQATWNIWKTSNNWSTAGGFHTNDCEQTDIASLSLTSTESAGEKIFSNFSVSLLEEMINGVFTNNGFLIKNDTEYRDGYLYRSSDYGTSGERPKMVIEYTVASGNFFLMF